MKKHTKVVFAILFLCVLLLAGCSQQFSGPAIDEKLLSLMNDYAGDGDLPKETETFNFGGKESPVVLTMEDGQISSIVAEMRLDDSKKNRSYCENMVQLLKKQLGNPAHFTIWDYSYSAGDFQGRTYSYEDGIEEESFDDLWSHGGTLNSKDQLSWYFPLKGDGESPQYFYCTFTTASLEDAHVTCEYGIMRGTYPIYEPPV